MEIIIKHLHLKLKLRIVFKGHKSLGEESNPQQSYYKYDVLPLNYLSKDSPVEIRTPTKGTKNLCATITPPENN